MTNKDAVNYINEIIKKEIDNELNQPVKWINQDVREIYFKSGIALKMANEYLKSLGYRTQTFYNRYSLKYAITYALNYPLNEAN